jgi:hypothetical protein
MDIGGPPPETARDLQGNIGEGTDGRRPARQNAVFTFVPFDLGKNVALPDKILS